MNRCPPSFAVRVRREPQRVLVDVTGELDLATVEDLARSLDALLTADCAIVAVDLVDVSFIDATGLRALIEAGQRYETVGASLSIVGESAPVSRLLDICEGVPEVRRMREQSGGGAEPRSCARVGPVHWSGGDRPDE